MLYPKFSRFVLTFEYVAPLSDPWECWRRLENGGELVEKPFPELSERRRVFLARWQALMAEMAAA